MKMFKGTLNKKQKLTIEWSERKWGQMTCGIINLRPRWQKLPQDNSEQSTAKGGKESGKHENTIKSLFINFTEECNNEI